MSSGAVALRDDRGRRYRFASPPRRVVSLVPSDTYSLVRLGVGDRLIGRSRYCVAPVGLVESVEIVGGTKDADVERIIALAPDVVIANQEENTKSDVEQLEAAGLRVLVSFPRTVSAGLAHLARLAVLFGGAAELPAAKAVIKEAYEVHRDACARRAASPPVRVFLPIWMDPLMTIDGDTFISDALDLVGAVNVFSDRHRRYPLAADLGLAEPLPASKVGDRDVRYPRVTRDEIVRRRPDLVLLPDEPHEFTEADANFFRGLELPVSVQFCDGKDLMWYGARSVEGLGRLRALVDSARPR